jgi:hypothetical protein
MGMLYYRARTMHPEMGRPWFPIVVWLLVAAVFGWLAFLCVMGRASCWGLLFYMAFAALVALLMPGRIAL